MSTDALLVFTHVPDEASAQRITEAAIAARLAACVTRLAPATSTYRWQGRVECETEIPLLLKTRRECYAALQELVRELHPYEVPEILALAACDALPAWLDWLRTETTPTPTP